MVLEDKPNLYQLLDNAILKRKYERRAELASTLNAIHSDSRFTATNQATLAGHQLLVIPKLLNQSSSKRTDMWHIRSNSLLKTVGVDSKAAISPPVFGSRKQSELLHQAANLDIQGHAIRTPSRNPTQERQRKVSLNFNLYG